MKNHYTLLQIPNNATAEKIQYAYSNKEKIARVNKDKSQKGMRRYNLLKEAFATLIDPQKRAEYDRQLLLVETPVQMTGTAEKTNSTVLLQKPASTKDPVILNSKRKNKENMYARISILAFLLLLTSFLIYYFINHHPMSETKKPNETKKTHASATCVIPNQPTVKKYKHYPDFCINVNKTYTAIIHTTLGDIELQLLAKNAPKTVNSFVFLSRSGFFNDIIIHRVIPQFVIQFGDPQGNGTGGPGYSFKDEINPQSIGLSQDAIQSNESSGYSYDSNLNTVKITQGIVAMANSGPNTNGSQLFITLSDQPSLDGKYTPFAKVTNGMDVANAIATVAKGSDDKPTSPISIKTIEITEN